MQMHALPASNADQAGICFSAIATITALPDTRRHDITEFTVGTRFHRSVYKDAIALEPALRTIDGVELAYQVPPREPIGVLVTAHGCAHRGTDFWEPSPKRYV
jgi:hypothetical protein